MNQVVTEQSLGQLLARLKTEHPDDPGVADLALDDMVNDALNPGSLGAPKIQALKDVPLLTTDFYYIAERRQRQRLFVPGDGRRRHRARGRTGPEPDYACVRNISDPVVPRRGRKRISRSPPPCAPTGRV